MASITSNYQPITFNAVWNNENNHLAESLIEKVTRYAFFIINKIVTPNILPSTRTTTREYASIQTEFERKWSSSHLLSKQFRPRPLEVTAPDGTKLQGTYFKNAAATETSPTVIFFQPNAMLSKEGCFDWVMSQAALREEPYNFVYFDYRGCDGVSDAPRQEKDLYLDGESIYQFVRDHLKVPPNDIHFYGWSLGGGVSANVKAMHQECTGNYVNDRSFTCVNDVIKNFVHRIIAAVGGFFVSMVGWNITATTAIENLKGKTLIVHHPDDEMMRNEASLGRYFFGQNAPASPNIAQVDLSRAGSRQPDFIHGGPMECFEREDFKATDEIAKFLFRSDLTLEQKLITNFRNSQNESFRNRIYAMVANEYQNGGYYWGSGEDACYNRNGQSISDAHLAEAIAICKVLLPIENSSVS